VIKVLDNILVPRDSLIVELKLPQQVFSFQPTQSGLPFHLNATLDSFMNADQNVANNQLLREPAQTLVKLLAELSRIKRGIIRFAPLLVELHLFTHHCPFAGAEKSASRCSVDGPFAPHMPGFRSIFADFDGTCDALLPTRASPLCKSAAEINQGSGTCAPLVRTDLALSIAS
jgi:hypothetical protein